MKKLFFTLISFPLIQGMYHEPALAALLPSTEIPSEKHYIWIDSHDEQKQTSPKTPGTPILKQAIPCLDPECKKSFDTNTIMKRHFKSCHEKVRYTCPNCSRDYSDPDNFNRHMRDNHRYGQAYTPQPSRKTQCVLCKNYFANLAGHLRERHPEEKAYTCPQPDCLMQFQLPSELTKHRKIHGRECPYCQQIFKQSYTLRRHLIKEHQTTLGKRKREGESEIELLTELPLAELRSDKQREDIPGTSHEPF